MAENRSSKVQSTSDEHDARLQKHKRKMTKIMGKVWSFPSASIFHTCKWPTETNRPMNLKAVGQNLDDGFYQHGRKGWKKFAFDIGAVFNTHISTHKNTKLAKENLENALKLLEKIDASLATKASEATPIIDKDTKVNEFPKISKKRKSNDNDSLMNAHVPKKRSSNTYAKHHSSTLTLSQREEQAMQDLASYVEECGGDRQQVLSFHANFCHRGGSQRDEIIYFSPQGQRYRKKADVVRFLGLTPTTSKNNNNHHPNSSSRHSNLKTSINTGRPRNARDCENERKRLKKEVDKLLKLHAKHSKSLDEIRNEYSNEQKPLDDLIVLEEKNDKEQTKFVSQNPDMCGYPGIPAHCTGDLLMVWDFFCTFFRVLSLEPIDLDNFVAALTFKPSNEHSSFDQNEHFQDQASMKNPVYIAESHLALLKLLLNDPASDDWWWSTLESDTTNVEGESDFISSEHDNKGALAPVIKVNMADLLDVEEDPMITTKWLQALEDVRTRKTNSGGPIKSAVKSAISITTNPIVKTYLQKAMRKWKGNAASFTKRAVVWLIDKVREARPDLWGKKVSKEAVHEQTSKVARDAAAVMDLFEEDADVTNEVNSNLDEVSDDEDESEDEEEDDGDEYIDDDDDIKKKSDDLAAARRKTQNYDDAPVTSGIPLKPPPTIIDLLLPPSKPTFNSDVINPISWPCVVGASVCRILHRYKRQRNDVDDELREFHLLPPMSIATRRKREKIAAQRIFSESFASCKNYSQTDFFPIEAAIDHLCAGKPYHELLPIQKLCVFRTLVEAAYDTTKVAKAIEENFRSRINAVKSLESEEKRAKREAREEASAAEKSARERLTNDARDTFIAKKKNELKHSNIDKYTPEYIDNIDIDEIIQLNDETRQEYDALPAPENFSKAEVNAMVAKINEESAFECSNVLVLTLDEIKAREEDHLDLLEQRLSSFGEIKSMYDNNMLDRETSVKVDKLKREIDNYKTSLLDLPQKRENAIEVLNEAIEEGTVKELKFAIKTAKLANLFGSEESTEGIWVLDSLRDAALELKSAERRRRVTEAQRELVSKRNKCFIRTFPLGQDKFRNCIWRFDTEHIERVWSETNTIFDSSTNSDEKHCTGEHDFALTVVGAQDEETDFIVENKSEDQHLFSRKEYHSSGLIAGLSKCNWGCHATEKSLRSIMKNCDQRGIRESALKARIKELLNAKGQGNADEIEQTKHVTTTDTTLDETKIPDNSKNLSFQSSGDENKFTEVIRLAKSEGLDVACIESLSSAIGKRIRIREEYETASSNKNIARYEMGTVKEWSDAGVQQITNIDENNNTVIEEVVSPMWRIALDKGNEVNLFGMDIVKGLTRAIKWSKMHDGYVENDASFFAYRNNLGRFCGRQIDAPHSASVFFFAKQMIKREAELYTPLKNRSTWNEWGGRSVARNTWVASMKDPDINFDSARNGLLTLETAFFELSGGFKLFDESRNEVISEEANPLPDGKALLENESYRFDIELESIISPVKSLWNSRETRAIFLEIIQSSVSVELLALGLDLMCRNCRYYIKATKSTSQYSQEVNITSTRRQNMWQRNQQVIYH